MFLSKHKPLHHLPTARNLTPFQFTSLPMTLYLKAHILANRVTTQSADVVTSPCALALKV